MTAPSIPPSQPADSAWSPVAEAIPFTCPFCHQETLVDPRFAGQSGSCFKCGKKITVPYVPRSPAASAGEVVVGIPHRTGASVGTIVGIAFGAVAAALIAVTAIVTLLIPAFNAARSVAYQHNCRSNLERIGEALQAYELQYGSLPPAYLADSNGKPMHSWRVLLLPFLDEMGLYSQYDFSQPWDSQQNMALAKKMPAVFACPADPDAAGLGETNYMVIRGTNTLFPGQDSVERALIGDEPRLTIMVVEVPAFGVEWLKPQDLDLESMQFIISEGYAEDIGSYHSDGAHALMADGSVRFLSSVVPPDYLRSMATPSGGEVVPDEILDY